MHLMTLASRALPGARGSPEHERRCAAKETCRSEAPHPAKFCFRFVHPHFVL
jgi:hypothetical protein